MEEKRVQNQNIENYHKNLSKRYELLIREDQEAEKNGENEKLKPEQSVMVIATTYFPEFDPKNKEVSDSVRGSLALESIERLNKKGINISVVDGGSSPLFTQMVGEINPRRFSDEITIRQPGTVEDSVNLLETRKESREKRDKMPGLIWLLDQKKRGYSQARIESIKNITDIISSSEYLRSIGKKGSLIQVEIEKTQLVDEIFNITQPISEGKADIVIPDRGIRVKELGDQYNDFRGYPKFQAVSERKANLKIHRMLVEAGLRKKRDSVLDLFGGTRAIKNTSELKSLFGETFEIPEDSPFWGKVKPEAYSNAVYFPIYVALSLDKKVKSVPIEFSYPKKQSELEKKNSKEFASKRKRQFDDIVTGSDLLINFLGKERRGGRIGRKKTSDKIIQRLKESSVLKLEELRWTDENEFSERYFYSGDVSMIERSITDENIINVLDQALESYFLRLDAELIAPDNEEFEKMKEITTLLKSEIEKRNKTEEAEKIYLKYHETALENLEKAVKLFHMIPQSEVSRNLDIVSLLAKFINVPTYGYIKAVILSTPNEGIRREFDSLADSFGVSANEKLEMIKRFSRETLQKAVDSSKEEWIENIKRGLKDNFGFSSEEIKKIEDSIKTE